MKNNNVYEQTLEQALLSELSADLNERELRAVSFLASGAFASVEEAKEIVGYIRSCRETKEQFKRIIAKYFPTT